MSATLEDLLVAAGILALLLMALEVGFVVGRRATTDPDARAGGQICVIQGAILGLLGLPPVFTFAAAGGRFSSARISSYRRRTRSADRGTALRRAVGDSTLCGRLQLRAA